MTMALPVPHRLIEKAVLRFETLRPHPAAASSAPPRVITISRQLGSGGRKIAEHLGNQLGWPVWDREILDVIASQSSLQIEARLFQALDEKGRSDVMEMIRPWQSKVSSYSYQYLLPKAILIIAQKDAIIIGRGAHVFLPRSLKVRVVAPVETRVANLIEYEGVTEPVARARIAASDKERHEFLRSLTHLPRSRVSQEPETEYDLTINTGTLDVPFATELVLTAVKARFGLTVAEVGGAFEAEHGPPARRAALELRSVGEAHVATVT
jgi:cytidylate kinase